MASNLSRFYGQNIQRPPLDDLFSSEEERQEAKLEKVQNIPLMERNIGPEEEAQERQTGRKLTLKEKAYK